MSDIYSVTVPIPTAGMTNDPRDRTPGVCRVATNFDIATDPKRATPYRDSEDGDSSSSTSKKQNFCIALRTGSTYSLFSLGVVSGTGRAEILYKDITTGASNDLDDAIWASPANNQSASGSTDTILFVYYKKVSKIFGAKSGTTIWSFKPDGSAFTETERSITYTNLAQGLVHSQDDILYIPYDNKIATNDNGTWNDTALTLPSDFYITSICEYGAFLGIACAPLSGIGHSRVYLWDRTSSLSTIDENIYWGEGIINVLEELQGDLIGISQCADSTRSTFRVTFRKYMGAPGSKRFKEFTTTTTPTIFLAKQKINNRIFFLMSLTLNGSVREGVWSVAKNEATGELSVAHERTPNNDTAISGGGLRTFFFVGDFLFISYTQSATYALSKSNDASSYTATSIIETVINPNMPPEHLKHKKKLLSVGAMYDPLPAAGQAVIKARVDTTSSYTSILTETTDNQVFTEPVPVPSAAAYLNDGKEFEFRIESTGAAVPTSFTYKYQLLKSNV